MAHYNTILRQITAFIPGHNSEYHADIHHPGQKFRSYNRWSQFMAMLVGQLSGRKSLRDIADNLKAKQSQLYHLGMKPTSRATLARVNERQPASLYEVMFGKLLRQVPAPCSQPQILVQKQFQPTTSARTTGFSPSPMLLHGQRCGRLASWWKLNCAPMT
ncbi:MAG: hypothetical protein C0613_04770 [Desulfobulbaceae bacterium]|mgnify:CR=1 FL=1|nr:MAG: hypothetical protein C0613_04770 [Desulfobulbaceae bacterium]